MTVDDGILRFSDAKGCGFRPNADGKIICVVHDDPSAGGLPGVGRGTRASKCEERKQWFESGLAEGYKLNPRLRGLLSRDHLPAWVQMRVIEHPDHWARTVLAERKNLAPEVQLRLATDVAEGVRKPLIRRDDLLPEVIVQLARDDHWKVRHSIAERMGLLSELHARVERDKEWLVAEVTARLGQRG